MIVFGAAVRAGSVPSPALDRRIKTAAELAEALPDAYIVVTGGAGRFPPSEAEVMKAGLVQRGISPLRILKDDGSRSTYESVLAVAGILRSLPALPQPIFVVTDTYHQWRCRLLLYLVGVKTRHARLTSGLPANGILRWSMYYVRDALAVPKDAFLILLRTRLWGR